jgi:type IV pilus assembly protein PilY1
MPFRWASLTAPQKALLNINPDTAKVDTKGADRVDYVRGKTNIPGFPKRQKGVLGDIVNSSPTYVKIPAETYPEAWDGPETSFKAFQASMQNRDEMVYVGANDGMLHAFDAYTGVERFAYVPSTVIENLNELTSANYSNNHRFYVDGLLKAQNAFFSAAVPAGWRTVLAGALRKGGKAVYALDVTDPTVNNETDVAKKLLWEFTDGVAGAPGADMGYVYGDIAVVRMANGVWAAVFGNGYNSASQKAVLYIVNIEDGQLITKIDMGAKIPTQTNGLASPLAVDINGDSVADYIYAGDLQGNVWKVDVKDKSPANWKLMYGTTPLFTAKDAAGNVLPITTRPEVGRNTATGSGYMVYFGTGKYIEGSDSSRVAQNTQTVFGIWDKDEPTLTSFDRSHLLQQEIYDEILTGTSVQEARLFTNHQIVWYVGTGLPGVGQHLGWYLDLINTGAAPADNKGERIINNLILRPGRIVFTSFVPPVDPCDPQVSEGWFFQFDSMNGGRLDYSVFDVNDDGVVLSPNDKMSVDLDLVKDAAGNLTAVSAVRVNKSGTPVLTPVPGSTTCMAILGTSLGGVQTVTIPCDATAQGRQSWIRIQ